MEYTSEKIDSVARENLKRIPWGACMDSGTSSKGPFPEKLRNMQLYDIFRYQADCLNVRCGTYCRKTVRMIAEELSARGFDWVDIFGDMTEITTAIDSSRFSICYNKGIDVRYLIVDPSSSMSKPVHCTACAEDIVDFLEFIAKVETHFDTLLKEKCLRAQKSKMVSDIEFPLVEMMVKGYMDPRGIQYNLFQKEDKIMLEVNIVKEIWMSNRVTSKDLESLLGIVPYLIKRPDCIARDGRGFKIIRKYNSR